MPARAMKLALVGLALLSAAESVCAQGAARKPSAGTPADVELLFPLGLAMAPDGSLYISERRGHRIRRVDLRAGTVTTVAGTGERGFSGDGGPASVAQLGCPDSIDLDRDGNLYIADRCNERIRRVDARTGIITTIAGTGERAAPPMGRRCKSL